jgi:hypothetical protein
MLEEDHCDLDATHKILENVKAEQARHRAAHATLNENERRAWLRNRRETIPHVAEKLEALIREHLRHLDPPLKNALDYTATTENPFSTGPAQPTHPVLKDILDLLERLKTDPIFQPRAVRPAHRPDCPAVPAAEADLRRLGIREESVFGLLCCVGVKD